MATYPHIKVEDLRVGTRIRRNGKTLTVSAVTRRGVTYRVTFDDGSTVSKSWGGTVVSATPTGW